MITQFKIFENVNPPKSEVRKLVNNSEFTQNYSEDYGAIYTYRNVTFGWWGNIYVNIENKYLPKGKLVAGV